VWNVGWPILTERAGDQSPFARSGEDDGTQQSPAITVDMIAASSPFVDK
jgi:hypothetical protein